MDLVSFLFFTRGKDGWTTFKQSTQGFRKTLNWWSRLHVMINTQTDGKVTIPPSVLEVISTPFSPLFNLYLTVELVPSLCSSRGGREISYRSWKKFCKSRYRKLSIICKEIGWVYGFKLINVLYASFWIHSCHTYSESYIEVTVVIWLCVCSVFALRELHSYTL